jgi:hypothetical protein
VTKKSQKESDWQQRMGEEIKICKEQSRPELLLEHVFVEDAEDLGLMFERLLRSMAAYPDNIPDKKWREIDAKFPVRAKRFPNAMLHWVEYQLRNNKKFTPLKRRQLLKILYLSINCFEFVDSQVCEKELDQIHMAIMCAYLIGVTCPSPYEGLGQTAEARKRTTGRVPRWHAVANKVMAELATKKSSVISTAVHKTTRISILHPRLNDRLTELEMKPVSPSSVRNYLTRFDKERT